MIYRYGPNSRLRRAPTGATLWRKREGNGRLARWVADLMSLQASYPLPGYRFTGRGAEAEKKRYLSAVKKGYQKDYEALAAFSADAIERGRADS